MNVYFPDRLNAQSMHQLISNLIDAEGNVTSEKVTFNFGSLRFIDPVGITVLSNLIELLKKKKIKVAFQQHTYLTDATQYLDDSLFFEHYLKQRVFVGSSPRGTTLPLRLLRHEQTHSWIANTLIPWLEQRLSISARSLRIIGTCLEELFNNIKDHSREEIGSIFVQHYPKNKTVNIALSDFGVGIPYNIYRAPESVYKAHGIPRPISDGHAILLATKEGFSSHSTVRNRGAGLDTFLNILNRNCGRAVIHSNKGVFSCSPTNRGYRDTERYYPGTLLDINFRTDTLRIEDNEDEQFAWDG